MAVAAVSSWLDLLITALAALGGAVIGAGTVIWSAVRAEHTERQRERRDALVGFYAAANSFALMWDTWAAMQIKGPLGKLRLGIRMAGMTGTFLARLWQVADGFWQASAQARASATREELEAVEAVESVIAEWRFGERTPEDWGPAIRRVRAVLERRAPDDPLGEPGTVPRTGHPDL
jgi:MFS family permease